MKRNTQTAATQAIESEIVNALRLAIALSTDSLTDKLVKSFSVPEPEATNGTFKTRVARHARALVRKGILVSAKIPTGRRGWNETVFRINKTWKEVTMKSEYVSPYAISDQITRVRQDMKKRGMRYCGLRVLNQYGETEALFLRGDRNVNVAIANLDKAQVEHLQRLQKPGVPIRDCFRVFRNMNNEVAVQEVAKLPFFHLV